MQSFQKLFCTIVRARIVRDAAVAEMLFSQLHHNPQNTDTEISAKQKKAEERKQKYGRVEVESADGTKDNVVIRLLPLEHLSKDIVNAFTIASQLLVDYSCFPMYCTDQQKVLKSTLKKGNCFIIFSIVSKLNGLLCFLLNVMFFRQGDDILIELNITTDKLLLSGALSK